MSDNKLNIIKKIVTFEDMPQSQLDRLNLQNEAYSNLVSYLHNIIEKIQSGTSLRKKLEDEINKLIAPEDEIADRLSPNQLINLFSIILKFDSEQSTALINTLKESLKINVNQNNDSNGNNTGNLFPASKEGDIFTKKDIQDAKKVLHIANSIQDSEMSLDELDEILRDRKNK